jgi:hypothetical protein
MYSKIIAKMFESSSTSVSDKFVREIQFSDQLDFVTSFRGYIFDYKISLRLLLFLFLVYHSISTW